MLSYNNSESKTLSVPPEKGEPLSAAELLKNSKEPQKPDVRPTAKEIKEDWFLGD